jgi:hypothetical protein
MPAMPTETPSLWRRQGIRKQPHLSLSAATGKRGDMKLWNDLLHLFFPRLCLLCDEPLVEGEKRSA